MKPLRLAMVGAGAMARYHLAAAKETGFELYSLAASPGSIRARSLAAELDVRHSFDTAGELLAAEGWDAVVIAVDVPVTLELMLTAAESGRPVLVEKPVAEHAAKLKQYAHRYPNVRVAYNRRFYRSVQAARDFLRTRGPAQVIAQVPEAFAGTAGQGSRGRAVRHNSVHVFDLLRFLLGDLEVFSVFSPGGPDRDLGRVMVLGTADSGSCVIYANWDHPANFSVAIDASMERFELRPLEFGFHYRGMQVDEPTELRPLRVYRPMCVAEVGLEPEANRFKPGFLGQMDAFRSFAEGTQAAGDLATLEDALEALRIAEVLIEGLPVPRT